MTDAPGIIVRWETPATEADGEPYPVRFLRLPITEAELEVMDRARDPDWWSDRDIAPGTNNMKLNRLASLRRAIEALISIRRAG